MRKSAYVIQVPENVVSKVQQTIFNSLILIFAPLLKQIFPKELDKNFFDLDSMQNVFGLLDNQVITSFDVFVPSFIGKKGQHLNKEIKIKIVFLKKQTPSVAIFDNQDNMVVMGIFASKIESYVYKLIDNISQQSFIGKKAEYRENVIKYANSKIIDYIIEYTNYLIAVMKHELIHGMQFSKPEYITKPAVANLAQSFLSPLLFMRDKRILQIIYNKKIDDVVSFLNDINVNDGVDKKYIKNVINVLKSSKTLNNDELNKILTQLNSDYLNSKVESEAFLGQIIGGLDVFINEPSFYNLMLKIKNKETTNAFTTLVSWLLSKLDLLSFLPLFTNENKKKMFLFIYRYLIENDQKIIDRLNHYNNDNEFSSPIINLFLRS